MKKNRLTLTALAMAGALALTALAVGRSQIKADLCPDMTVVINGQTQTMKDVKGNPVHPILYKGTTYLPIRAIGEALDYDVAWNGATQTVTLTDRATPAADLEAGPAGLEARLADLTKQVQALKSGSTYAERVKQYNELDRELTTLEREADLLEEAAEADFWNGKTDYATYSALDLRLDKVEDDCEALRRTLASKTLAKEDAPTTQPSTQQTKDYAARIAALDREAGELVKQADAVTDLAGYRSLKTALDRFEDKADALEDELERAYKTGALTATDYRGLDRSLELAEDRVDDLDDIVEYRLGIDD